MTGEGFRERLLRSGFVRAVHWFDEVDSTNDALRRLAAEGAVEGTVVVAGGQTRGRGRLGRRWHSPPGLGLYLSILLRPSAPPMQVTRWTVAAAVAVCEACRAAGATEVAIEWPNDLTAGGRKLAGILAELRSSGSRTELVLGSGVNVSHRAEDFPQGVDGTSLALLVGEPVVDRVALAESYLERLAAVCARLERGAWSEVAGRWETLSRTGRDRAVRVARGDASFTGTTAGLGARGQLRVRRSNGVVEDVHLADSVEYLER